MFESQCFILGLHHVFDELVYSYSYSVKHEVFLNPKSWRAIKCLLLLLLLLLIIIIIIIIIIIYSLEFFLHQRKLIVFHWRLSDIKSPQVSGTLLSILAVFNNAVVWMVSTRTLTSKSSRPFNNSLVTVPKAPITIGIIVTFMLHSFFQFCSKVEVLISLFPFFQFYSMVSQDSKVDSFADFLFCCWLRSGRLAEIRWSLCMSKSDRSLCVIF